MTCEEVRYRQERWEERHGKGAFQVFRSIWPSCTTRNSLVVLGDAEWWSQLVTAGHYLSLFVTANNIWSQLVAAGHSWSLLVTAGRIWSQLVTAGHCWSQLVTAGHSWSLLVTADHKWSQMVTDGYSWSQMVTDGHRWLLSCLVESFFPVSNIVFKKKLTRTDCVPLMPASKEEMIILTEKKWGKR